MLVDVGLKNFKAFGEDLQIAPTSKITLIYGPNSGGKSSILQALLLLKQSLRDHWDHAHRELIPRGDQVDLGSFSALIHRHDPEQNLEIGVTFKNGNQYPRSVTMTFSNLEHEEPDSMSSSVLSSVRYRIIDKYPKHSSDGTTKNLLEAELKYDSSNHWIRSYSRVAGSELPNQLLPEISIQGFLPKLSIPGEDRLSNAEATASLRHETIGRSAEEIGIELGHRIAMGFSHAIRRIVADARASESPRSDSRKIRARTPSLEKARLAEIPRKDNSVDKESLWYFLSRESREAESSFSPFIVSIRESLRGQIDRLLMIVSDVKLIRRNLRRGLYDGLRTASMEDDEGIDHVRDNVAITAQARILNVTHALSLALNRELSQALRRLEKYPSRAYLASSPVKNLRPEFLKRLEVVINQVTRDREVRRRINSIQSLYALLEAHPNLHQQQIIQLTPGDISTSYDDLLSSIRYLGPLRSYPERVYMVSGQGHRSVGARGEYAPHILYQNRETVAALNRWFADFQIPYELKIREFGDIILAGKYITITLHDRANTAVTLSDVGFGINQLLPILIEGIASPENTIVCVEQPEIHLHPRLQAHLADLMIATSRDENGARKQWIIETHSELLMRRIQRRIREGKIDYIDVSVIYVDPSRTAQDGSMIDVLRLDRNGDFTDEWPHGFFDEGFNELTGDYPGL